MARGQRALHSDQVEPHPETDELRAIRAELEESLRAADAGEIVDGRAVIEEMRARIKAGSNR